MSTESVRFIANNLDDTTLITKAEGLVAKHRGERLLLIAPETAGWTVLAGKELDFWNRWQHAQNWDILKRMPNALTLPEREKLVTSLYKLGLINWNGRYYHNLSTLWRPVQTYPTFLCIHLTEACNFGCKYCMADSLPGKGRISVQTAELIVEKCLRELPPQKLTFDFHGGEPLMAWEVLRHTIEYARMLNERDHLGKSIKFIFQTNGSLLTAEKIKILKELDVTVGLSLDGPQDVHDKNRIFAVSNNSDTARGTFNTVMEHYHLAQQMGMELGLLGVIHEPSDYLKTFDFFVNTLNKRYFRLNYSSYIGRSAKMLDFPSTRAEAFAERWLQMADTALEWCRQHQERLDISDLNIQINNLVSKNRPFMCYRSPCGAGNSILGFAIDGGIHACEEMASSGVLRLGNVYDKNLDLADMVENNELFRQIQQRHTDTIPHCKRCPLRHFCSAGCTSKTLAYYGDYMHESPMCRFYKRVFEGLMWRIHDNPDILNWLGAKYLGNY